MNVSFSDVVEIVQDLPLDEKEEIRFILEKSINDEKREIIHENHLLSLKEEKEGKLKFSSNLSDLKKMLD